MWPEEWSRQVKMLEEGNERIIGIELNTHKGCIYILTCTCQLIVVALRQIIKKHLDILHSLLVKYRSIGTVVISGDLNGTLVSSRNNQHDVSLKEFVQEHQLSWSHTEMETTPTFVSHTGNTVTD